MPDVIPEDQQNERDIEKLLVDLHNEDGNTRAIAAQTLGKLGNRQAVEPLIAALNDPDYWLVRCNAAEALGEMGDLRAVEPLIASLKQLDVNTQAAAAEALGNLGDPRAIEPLSALLKMGTDRTFQASADALEKLGDSTIAREEQAVRAKREERSRARAKSVKSMRRGGSLILVTIFLAGIVIRMVNVIVSSQVVSYPIYLFVILIAAVFVLIGAFILGFAFLKWLWLNHP